MTAPSGALAGRRVLVLEDEFFLADDLAATLRAAGAVVVGPFSTVDQALQALETGAADCDLAILDLNLRGVRSYPVADLLTARGVPFVFVTGLDSPDLERRYVGARRCEKPVDLAGLLAALR